MRTVRWKGTTMRVTAIERERKRGQFGGFLSDAAGRVMSWIYVRKI